MAGVLLPDPSPYEKQFCRRRCRIVCMDHNGCYVTKKVDNCYDYQTGYTIHYKMLYELILILLNIKTAMHYTIEAF